MKEIINTQRLILCEYILDDFEYLFEIMPDKENMEHYPAPLDEERTRKWIEWNLDNYKKYGFGKWNEKSKRVSRLKKYNIIRIFVG